MTTEILIALIPYFISAGMSFAIAAYCWRRRTVAGADFFAAMALCRGLLTIGYIFELLSPTLDGKIFWDDLQFYPSYIASVALLAFAVHYGDYRVLNRRVVWGGLLAIVALFSLATITNPSYHLLRGDASLIPGQPFASLTYPFTTGFLIYVAYTYILYLVSLGLLIARLLRASALFRGQLGTIVIGNSIPLVGASLTLFGVIPTFQRETTPFWFAVSNAVVWWGLYHYRLFDLAPIARDKLVEQMNDIVIVVDAENRVVDMNRAAELARGLPAKELIGKSASEAFPAQLSLIERITTDTGAIDTEIHPAGPNAAHTYQLTATPLTGRGGKLIGRLIVAHDITVLKEAQAAVDAERAKLKKMVARRTAALTRANKQLKQEVTEREEIARDLEERDERLKRLADAAFEGIAISESGVLVETNQQLAAMLGYAQEELIGKKISLFTAPESRADVERRVRMNEEAVYDHIAMRKDGTKFPVEVRSRTLQLRDRVLRMTAVRDMTEQRDAEMSVRLSEERFRLILDNMPILLDAFDEDGKIMVWNKACEDATGYTAEEMIGNPNAMELLYPDPEYREEMWRLAMDPNNRETTFELTAKNGEKRTIMWFETFRQVEIPGWPSWGLGLDVTETRRAEAAERASRALSDALADTAGALSSNLELDEVLDRVLANVGKSVEHDAADIMLIKEGNAHVVRSMANGMDINTEGIVYPVKRFPLMAKLVKSNKPIMVQDTLTEPLWTSVPENSWIRSLLAVPVRRQGKVIGIINLLKREPHAFSDEHARRLAAFADQAAVAIHNAQLYRTERENRELAEALRDTIEALSSKLSLEEVLDSVFDNLKRVLPHYHANVMLLEGDMVRVVGMRGYSPELEEVLEQVTAIHERPNLEQMRKTLRPVVVPEIDKNPDWISLPGFEVSQSYVGAPIRIGKNVIGFLNLYSEIPGYFDESVIGRLTAFADQAAIAIHNAQLYRTERENRELAEALRDSIAVMSSKLSQDEVLSSILDNLDRVLPHDAANVMLINGDTARIVGKHGYDDWNLPEPIESVVFPIRKRVYLQKMRKTRRPVVVPDTQQDPDWVRLPGFEKIRSYCAAPIRIGGSVIGFMNLSSEKPGFFSESVIERLTAFADQAAIAMTNAQLYITERENRELAEALRDSTAALSSKLSQEEVLDTVFDNLNRVLPHDAANVMLLEDGVVWVVGKRGYSREQDDALEKMRFPIEERPNLVKMCKTLKPVVVPDTKKTPNWIRNPGFGDVHSYVGAPIRVDKKVIGFLNLSSKMPGFFDESVTERLTAFADQAAIAIHNAQLYRTERENRELAEALRDSTAALSSKLSQDEVLNAILDNLERVLPHDAANVMLVEGDVSRVIGMRGYERSGMSNDLLTMRFVVTEFSHLQEMLTSRRPVVISDTSKDPTWDRSVGVDWVYSYVGAPIRVGNEVIGFLNLDAAEPGFFDKSSLERLTAFADQVAIALHNAQLYRTEMENRELAEALRDSIAALSSKLAQEEVLSSILDNLERVQPHAAANIMLVDGEIARVVGRRGYTQYGLDDVLMRARRTIMELPNLKQMLETHEPVIISDTWSYAGWNKAPGFDWLRSYAGAPIIVGDTVIGFLNLDGDRVGFFDESVVERLKAFADQAAIAMNNAQLYRTEREHREMAEALRDSTAALNSKLSQEEVLESILENIGRVLPHDAANVMLIEGDVARIVGKRGYTRWNLDERLEKARYVIGERVQLQQMLATLKPVIITDTSKSPTWEVAGSVHWIQSYAGAPIRVGDEVIGFLNLDSAEPGFFDESTAERLTAFADQAAVALHNAHLYETERRERILAQMFQQLTEGVQGATSPSNILTIVLQALVNLVPYQKAFIGLLEEMGMRVEAEEGFEDRSEIMGKLYLFRDNPHLLQILSRGKPALFRPEDLPGEWESLPGIDKHAAIWIAMPLTTWDVTTGLLCLTLADSTLSNEDIITSVATFSQRARLALENSRLLIELLQSKGDLREAQSYLVRSAELAIAGEIATGVAHQISNPLTSVMAHAHLLLQKVQPDNPLYEYGKAIKDATDRAATVVQRMLDFARAREFEMQPVDINASLNTAASLVEPQITANARLILNLAPDLPRVIGSKEHLEDVWINLLINARDALKQHTEGVITLTSALDQNDDKSIIIQFQDNGPGIPLDAQGRIFSSFFTTKEEGVGLGLAICYDIITQHHGSIHVESREGSGANFIVRLPVGAAAGEN